MATKKVILYFDNQQDALRFTLAAGSVIADADTEAANSDVHALHLLKPLARATRIKVSHTASHDDDVIPASKAG